MKNIFTLLFIFCLGSTFAQSETSQEENIPEQEMEKQTMLQDTLDEEPLPEYIFAPENELRTHGIYVGIGLSYFNKTNRDFGVLTSRLAYVANNSFEFGFGAELMFAPTKINTNGDPNALIIGGLGGIHLKKIFYGQKRLSFSVPVFLGLGAIGEFETGVDNSPQFWNGLGVIDIGVNAEFNISRIIQFEAGLKYRRSNDFTVISPIEDLNSFQWTTMLKIGVFGIKGRKSQR